MLLTDLDDDTLYDALMARDPAYEGHAYVCVRTTGIFCRLTCPARKPKRENIHFEHSASACVESGFRPCRRCRPLDAPTHPLIGPLLAQLDAQPGRRWREDDLVGQGYDPSTVRRAFRRQFGMTFLQVARARRLGTAASRLAREETVIEAQLDAGYDSGSGFRDAFQRLIGIAPAAQKGRAPLGADWIETPIGPMVAIGDEDRLHLLEFNDRKGLPREVERLRTRTGAAIVHRRTASVSATATGLAAYFAGEASLPALPMGDHGTAFERTVWRALTEIPFGETRSYGEIAESIGRPSAVRAVARANGANQLALLLPCHRVIGADGALTGYAGGLWRKRWLLEHERRMTGQTGARPAVH
ncbi:bifunctional transcriptional activator/DNA repair enzyme AdaA [Pacificimonas flava]|uniref:methylated-DNA--[protein]-cysteine S-methyltransferase n=1 Tax=Pacificimonas flava TaxID=1234595 RepID=M2U2T8_9SPHN|nr:trifunctional transcriptional activator/DNA repair protein Ada/methylated-DNA--[protein]-cysteine S-methyltransferase [Pacificimonas flava]EMD82168.1 ADA regulatory protein / Methylated-DNA--protein-cysteine methyltransferase [Pacificimonas flava]MBB5280353.1 AraC family transcriptional regulator of adaptative response/methylated-DNA-[protein]-cysteine methyltransferase [Pacificimonas flava]